MDIRKLERGNLRTGAETQPGTVASKLRGVEADQLSTKEMPESGQTDTRQSTTEQLEAAEESIETSLAFLKKHGIEESHILAALDAMIVQGHFTWDFKLFGKIDCVFQTRAHWLEQMVIAKLEDEAPKTFAKFTGLLNLYNLAGSLKKIGSASFSAHSEEDLASVLQYLGGLPSLTVSRLTAQLVIFDRLAQVATSDWAVENLL